MNLTTRLVLLVVLSISPLVAIGIYNEIRLRAAGEREVERLALARTRSAAEQIAQVTNGVTQLLIAVAKSPGVVRGDRDACERYVGNVLVSSGAPSNLLVSDAAGHVFCSAFSSSTELDVSDRSYFRLAMASSEVVIGDASWGRILDELVLPFAYAVTNEQGERIGVVAAGLPSEAVARQLRSVSLPPGARITVTDRRGTIIAATPDNTLAGSVATAQIRELLHRTDSTVVHWISERDGMSAVVSYVPVQEPPLGLFVVSEIARDPYLAPIDEAGRRGAAALAMAVALSLLTGALISRTSIRRPLERLHHAVARWRGGEFQARASVADSSELGRLAQAFDDMAHALQQREAERAELERELVRSRDAARRANELTTRLLALASHDLREPVQALNASVAALVGRCAGVADPDLVAGVRRPLARLTAVLESLLTLTRIESRVVTPRSGDVALAGLFDFVASEVAALADARQVKLQVQRSEHTVVSDPRLLADMTAMLLAHAIERTTTGGMVTLRACRVDECTEIEVTHTAAGTFDHRLQALVGAPVPPRDDPSARRDDDTLEWAIVVRLSRLLDHPLRVGGSSSYTISVPARRDDPSSRDAAGRFAPDGRVVG